MLQSFPIGRGLKPDPDIIGCVAMVAKKAVIFSCFCALMAVAQSPGLQIVDTKVIPVEGVPFEAFFHSTEKMALVVTPEKSFRLNLLSGKIIGQISPTGVWVLASASPDLDTLAGVSRKGQMVVWDVAENAAKADWRASARGEPISLFYDGLRQRMALLTSKRDLHIYSTDGTLQEKFKTGNKPVCLTADSQNTKLFVFLKEGAVQVFDLQTLKSLGEFSPISSHEECVIKALSPSNCSKIDYFAVGLSRFDKKSLANRDSVFSSAWDTSFANTYVDEIHLFNGRTNTVDKILENNSFRDEIGDISLSPDGMWAATIHKSRRRIKIWDVQHSIEMSSSVVADTPTFIRFGKFGVWLVYGDITGNVYRVTLEGSGPCSSLQGTSRFNINGNLSIPNSRETVLGFMPFQVTGIDGMDGQSVASLAEHFFAGTKNLTLVERSRIDKVARELRLQNTGATDPEKAARIGRLLNAEYLVMGTALRFGEKLTFTLKLVKVETAQVMGTRILVCNSCGDNLVPVAIEKLCAGIFEID